MQLRFEGQSSALIFNYIQNENMHSACMQDNYNNDGFMKHSIIHIVRVVPPGLLTSSSVGATVHPVPFAFSPVLWNNTVKNKAKYP